MGVSALRGNTKSSEMLTRSDDAELAERFGAAIKLNRFAAELSMGSIDAKLLFLEFDLQDIGRELAACNRRFEALRARRVDLPECRAQAAAFARDVAKA